jgi:hypothetical protein
MPARDHFRAFARRPIHLTATVGLMNGSWQEAARVRDLGLGGACVEVLEPLAPGTPVRLQIMAPHLWDPLDLPARIAWTRDAQDSGAASMGLCVEHDSGKTLRWLVELLEADNYE